MTSIQTQVEGIVPTLNNLSLESLKLQAIVIEKENALKSSPLYIELQEAKAELQTNEAQQLAIREQGKDLMIQGWLKKVVTLDGTEISLRSSPGSLVVEEWTELWDQWYKVTKSLDKVSIKKAFNEGVQFPEGVYLQSDYSFVVKSK